MQEQQRPGYGAGVDPAGNERQAHGAHPRAVGGTYSASASARGRGQFTAARQDGPVYTEPPKKSKMDDCSIM